MANRMDDALGRIAACDTAGTLTHAWDAIIRDLGYAGFAYVDVRRQVGGDPLPYHLTTIPDSYVDTYVRGDFFWADPVVRRAAISNTPFTWADCPEFAETDRPRRGARSKGSRVIQAARDFGYTQGYAVPCHAVDKRGLPSTALISLFWRNQPEELGTADSTPSWLRLAASLVHERLLELRGVSSDTGPPPTLTDRERECLIWASRGKTRDETADILTISERTVEFHFENAMKKLGVYNKVHAVAVAIHLGLILP